jgi:hypothetical protein
MPVYGLLSTPPSVTPNAATNRQFLDQYLREYDRLERDWMSRMQPVQYPAGRPYTPGPFSQITPPAPAELAPPPSAFAPQGGAGGPGSMPGGPMGSIDRNPGNAFGASPIGRGVGIGLTAASMLGGPIGWGAGMAGLGMAANNIAANQAMRDFYGAPAMPFGQQLGGLFGGGLLGALGLGNASGPLALLPASAPAPASKIRAAHGERREGPSRGGARRQGRRAHARPSVGRDVRRARRWLRRGLGGDGAV